MIFCTFNQHWFRADGTQNIANASTLTEIFHMGLDSVELLIEIENYFRIRIPDQEAEKLDTIQKMCDSVVHHLDISDEGLNIKMQLFDRIVESLKKIDDSIDHVELHDPIISFISPTNKDDWSVFETYLQLEIPKPDTPRKNRSKLTEKILGLLTWTPSYDFEIVTVDQFIDALASCNYRQIVDQSNITSKFEVFVSVVGITVEKMGLEYYEVKSESSFTDDLGVD